MTMSYTSFLENKKHRLGNFGFDPDWFPDIAKDFQIEIIIRATKKGRMGIFADTGLGKTLMKLTIAKNIVRKTNGRVLILTPIAVAFQFLREAEKIGVDDIEHCRDGIHTKKIVVCNYERLHYLDPSDFICVMLDESSILKNFKGSTRDKIISFMKKINYRFLSTATPSPNDFIELGNSSEALGYLGYTDMLGKFFKNNQSSIDPTNRNIGEKFYLKPHAEKDFFGWVSQWSIMIKMPSDIGGNNTGYVLPKLHTNTHVVYRKDCFDKNGQGSLFDIPAKTMSEVRYDLKQTISERCEMASLLTEGKTSVYWCNLNKESEIIKTIDTEAVEILGSMSIDKKESILSAFSDGEIKRIITKAKMTGLGLNWQHCNHTVFFPTWSYEQMYQSIRRFWRFGQKNEVICDMVISEGQERVLDALVQKTEKAKHLYEKLVANTNRTVNMSVPGFNEKVKLPGFIQ